MDPPGRLLGPRHARPRQTLPGGRSAAQGEQNPAPTDVGSLPEEANTGLDVARQIRNACLSPVPGRLAGASLIGGLLGAISGLGGGIVIVPVLTIFMHVPIEQAIAAMAQSRD